MSYIYNIMYIIHTHTHTHTHTHNGLELSHKKEWDFCHLQQHGWTWMESIMLKNKNTKKTNALWYHLYVGSKNKTNVNVTKKKQTHI